MIDNYFADDRMYISGANPVNKKMQISNWKEYLKSAGLTFVSSFAVAFIPFLGGDDFHKAAIIAAVFTAARVALRAVLEMLALLRPIKSI